MSTCLCYTSEVACFHLLHRVVHAATYLAQTDGVVEGLSPRVEVHGLPHLLLAFILPGQVIGCSPVSCLVGYFSSLEKHQRDPGLCLQLAPPAWPTPETRLPSGCCPGNSGCGPGRSSPGPARSSAARRPSLPGFPGTGPTTSTAFCEWPASYPSGPHSHWK